MDVTLAAHLLNGAHRGVVAAGDALDNQPTTGMLATQAGGAH